MFQIASSLVFGWETVVSWDGFIYFKTKFYMMNIIIAWNNLFWAVFAGCLQPKQN